MTRQVVVVGSGTSGTLTAANLLRLRTGRGDWQVRLVEAGPVARGALVDGR